MLLPASPPSHRSVFIPVAESLADRGHKVEILSSLSPFTTSRNITQYNTGLYGTEFNVGISMFVLRNDPYRELAFFEEKLVPLAKELYTVSIVKDLYNRRKEYDLFIVDHMLNEMALPFVHEMPFITIATPGVDPMQSAIYGNVFNPSYFPAMVQPVKPPMTLYQRFINLVMHIGIPLFYNHWIVVPKVQKEISLKFPDLPPLLEINRNQSLTLMNSHFSIAMAVPLLPSQIEVAAMHCRPGKPLPQDIDDWLKGAGGLGVIYFSLGSIAKGTGMPSQYRDVFVEAFSRMKERVIWKYEEELHGLSSNVMMKSWFPQQDILSDPRVKLFISHGGLLSTQESMYHATPILTLPIFGDQPRNALNIISKGVGLSLDWDELTADLIIESIREIMTNPSYKRNADDVAKALQDQPVSPRDRAVFWTEYVIRHQGGPKLRCPAAKLSWIEFLMLDVIAVLGVLIIVVYLIIRKLFSILYSCIFVTNLTKTKKD